MFTFIRNLIEANKKTLRNSKGATMIEYALVVAAIVAVAVTYFSKTGTNSIPAAIGTKLNTVVSALATE